MEELLFNIFFWGVFVGGGTIFIIFAIIMAVKQYEQDITKQKKSKSENIKPNEPEYTTVTIKATVVDQTCCVKMVSIKTPKTVKEFVIVFQSENGDILKLNVPEEMYDGVEQGQTGVLSVVDGVLYGFELEEKSDAMS